ncbi:ABC transporter permease [Arenibacterium sp. LLYu02]|uniref:ABC transporter permease n=1 Tax=Arenibacterium sp. LLYu02 TaxID=3404132 RepID=UPI003B215EA2
MTDCKSMSALELLALAPPGWGGALLGGFATSIEVALSGYLLGLLIGVPCAFARRSGSVVAGDLVTLYTTIARAVPELVLILLAYFAVPQVINQALVSFGFQTIEINPIAAGILVIGMVLGAYATEVIRGAIAAIPLGHIEAAQSMGMHPLRILVRIILPEMQPAALPGLANLWLVATKDTALLAVIGVSELTLLSRQAGGTTKRHFLFLAAAGAIYLAVTLPRALARVLPTVGGEAIMQLKTTPLVATIAIVDAYAIFARIRQETLITYEPLLLLALLYLGIAGVIELVFHLL